MMPTPCKRCKAETVVEPTANGMAQIITTALAKAVLELEAEK
jgi:hypothetical protein